MRKGFTLIEVVLYVTIIAIMMTALIPFMGSILINGARSQVSQEVTSNARFVSEKIKSEIRKATAITSAFGSTLVLGETTFDLMNGKIRINGVNLNSDDTTISNLVFTNLVTGVKYSYTVSSNFGQSRKEYQSSIDIEGGAEMRSN